MMPKPLAVIGAARTGTNLLRDILVGTKAYANAGEILLPPDETQAFHLPFNYWHVMQETGRATVWRGSEEKEMANVAAYCALIGERAGERLPCIDLKPSYMSVLDRAFGRRIPVIIKALAAQGYHFIHVRRRNLLEQKVSLDRAQLTRQWIRSADEPATAGTKVTVDTALLVSQRDFLKRSAEAVETMLRDFRPTDVFYEDLLENGHPSADLRDRLKKGCGVAAAADYVPRIGKISPEPEGLIENIAAVRACLKGTAYQAFAEAAVQPLSVVPSTSTPSYRRTVSYPLSRLPRLPPRQLVPSATPAGLRPEGIHLQPETPEGGTFALYLPPGGPTAEQIRLIHATGEPVSLAPRPDGNTGASMALFSAAAGFRLRVNGGDPAPDPRMALFHIAPVEPAAGSQRVGDLPRILVIGAEKAGTSWLFSTLRRHPRVGEGIVKEVCFQTPRMSRQSRLEQMVALKTKETREPNKLAVALDFALADVADEGWYRSMFRLATPGSILMDATPEYSLFPISKILGFRQITPDARIVFLMRDPVERAISAALMVNRERGVDAPSLPHLKAALADPALLERGDYRGTLERWTGVFGPDQVRPFFFDDIRDRPEALLNSICGFVGLDPRLLPEIDRTPVNAGTNPFSETELAPLRRELSRHYLSQLEWLSDTFHGPADTWLQTAREQLTRTESAS
jgi:LPS sulfotransferase NodH